VAEDARAATDWSEVWQEPDAGVMLWLRVSESTDLQCTAEAAGPITYCSITGTSCTHHATAVAHCSERKCAENYNKRQQFFFLNCKQHFSTAISNNNSFRVLFDEIVSVYFI